MVLYDAFFRMHFSVHANYWKENVLKGLGNTHNCAFDILR